MILYAVVIRLLVSYPFKAGAETCRVLVRPDSQSPSASRRDVFGDLHEG